VIASFADVEEEEAVESDAGRSQLATKRLPSARQIPTVDEILVANGGLLSVSMTALKNERCRHATKFLSHTNERP
jgi:hypothetical protein